MPRRKGKPNAKIRRIFLFSKFSARFFIRRPARRRASFPKAGAKVRLFSVHANLSRTFFCRFLEFIFKCIVIQPFTDEWFLMKGLRCTESYTLLYYICNKQSDFNRQKYIRLYPTIKPYASTNAACFISLPSKLCSKRHINTNYSLLINRSRSTM